jgi:Flp pilus assembly protein, pilin Flp
MKNFLNSFLADESGASAAEYALILAVVGAGIVAAAGALGTNIKEAMSGAAEKICEKPENGDSLCASAG